MHNVENFGGRRIPNNGAPGIVKVQFDCIKNMSAWLSAMRKHYNSDQFSPSVNFDALVVCY